jgi:hypothetical protein
LLVVVIATSQLELKIQLVQPSQQYYHHHESSPQDQQLHIHIPHYLWFEVFPCEISNGGQDKQDEKDCTSGAEVFDLFGNNDSILMAGGHDDLHLLHLFL